MLRVCAHVRMPRVSYLKPVVHALVPICNRGVFPFGVFRVLSAGEDFTVSPRDAIIEAVRDSLAEAFGEGYRGSNPMVTSATKPEFGDYQARVNWQQ